MKRLADEVAKELRRFGPQAGMPELVARWSSAVGEQIARNAWPARIARDGTLHVATSSSAWAFELANLQKTVLDRLRAALGDSAPRRLVFAPGRVPEAPAAEAGRDAPAPRAPTESDRSRAAELTAGIGDEELRDRVARALAAALAGSRDGRSF